jgi:hypothetical protein
MSETESKRQITVCYGVGYSDTSTPSCLVYTRKSQHGNHLLDLVGVNRGRDIVRCIVIQGLRSCKGLRQCEGFKVTSGRSHL